MGHKTAKSYLDLQARLNRSAQGAPASTTLYRLLEVLFTEREAELVSNLPLRFFDAAEAAQRWSTSEAEAEGVLQELADKAILLDAVHGDRTLYVLAPTMAGFFEFSLMRLDGRFDKKLLSELFHQYINTEDAFVRQIFGLRVPIDRVFVQEETLSPDDASVILDYERASEVVRTATAISVGTCYCRHKLSHLGEACKAPEDVCLTFNTSAESLIRHGVAREISADEAMAVLDRCIRRGLVQIGDNVQNGVNWICNCCGCCCEAILAYKRLGHTSSIESNYVVVHGPADAECDDCGNCVRRCPVDAITKRADGAAQVGLDLDRCFGCGVCVRACKPGSLRLARRSETQFVPENSFERVVLSAIDEGKLQNYIFDNTDLWTHNTLRKLLGVLLGLPPIKQVLANQQLQSRFVRAVTSSGFVSGFVGLYEDGQPQ